MAGVNDMSKNCVFHHCSGCKRRRISIPPLPKDIIFKILLCLPADIIYNVMRYVCREWYNIIKDPLFIDAHTQELPIYLLVQRGTRQLSVLCVKIKHGIEIIDLSWSSEGVSSFWSSRQFLQYNAPCCLPPKQQLTIFQSQRFPGWVKASCRGLVLFADKKFWNCLHVANPLTKKWVSLPPIRVSTWNTSSAGLAYAASCKKYKVAYTQGSSEGIICRILSIGVDTAWRNIFSIRDISCIPRKLSKEILWRQIGCTGGYMHWFFGPYVLSLEVETETFHVSVFPKEFSTKNRNIYRFTTESHLFFTGRHRGEFTWELWALTKVETGEWTRFSTIDLTAKKAAFEEQFGQFAATIKPVGLLKNCEIVMFSIFCGVEHLLVYNVKTGEIYFHKFKGDWAYVNFCSQYVESLAWL